MDNTGIYMAMKQTALADMVLTRRTQTDGLSPSAIKKMKKADLTAILVQLDDLAQDIAAAPPLINENQSGEYKVHRSQLTQKDFRHLTMQDFKAFKAARNGEVRRNLKKVQCGCGQFKGQLDNGTMEQHTRHNIVATAREIRMGAAPERVHCLWSGKFPPRVKDMRHQMNNHLHGHPLGYLREQTPDTRGPKTFADGGSRRARRVGTKNKHRAKYGKRFQVAPA